MMLHIMGLVIHLSSSGYENLSFVAAILKKQVSDLKSYCHELGLIVEAKKTKTKDGEIDDFSISLNKNKKPEDEAEPATNETQQA